MHERYAYGALVFLLLLIPERRIAWLYLAFGVVFTLNLLSAAPPAPIFTEWLPFRASIADHRLAGDDRDHVRSCSCGWPPRPRGRAGRPGPSGRGRRRSRLAIVRR